MRSVVLTAVAVGVLLALTAAAETDFDVVVYGSSPAGIAAATAAGKLGMRVALYGKVIASYRTLHH